METDAGKHRDRDAVRPLAFLSSVRLILNTGFRFVYPFLPAIGRGLGVSLEQAGFLVSARWAAGFTTPLVVHTAGRGEARRRLIVLGIGLFTAGTWVTAATGVYVGALVGFVLMGIAKPTFDISAQAYIADRVAYRSRARYLSVFELTWAGALLVGAPLAGWLISRGSWSTPFWVLGALAAASLLIVPLFIDRDGSHDPAQTSPIRLDRSAVVLLGVIALFSMAAEIMFVVFGAWLEDSFGLSIAALGGAALVIGFAELAGEGATFAFTDRLGKRRSVLIGLLVSATGFGLLVPAHTRLGLGMAIMAIALLGFEFTIVSSIPLTTEVRPLARTRYLALTVVAMATGRSIGAAVGPILFGAFGMAGNSLVAATADVVAAILLVAWVREASQPGRPASLADAD